MDPVSIGGTASYEHAEFGGRMAKCPECGKRFFRHTHSVYGARCSYTCYRAAQKREEAMRAQRRAEKERIRQDTEEAVRLLLERKRTLEAMENERKNAIERVLYCRLVRKTNEQEAERAGMGTYQRKNARRRAQTWTEKERKARERLEAIEKRIEEVKKDANG